MLRKFLLSICYDKLMSRFSECVPNGISNLLPTFTLTPKLSEIRVEESRIAIPIGSTLDRFIKDKQSHSPGSYEGLPQILFDIVLASKVINREINKAGLVDILGAAGSTNSAGDHQQKLDLLANIRFTRALLKGREVCALVSEESETYTELNKNGKYIITMDPLDGSSNIDVNVSIGTIFSVYQRKSAIGSA